MHAYLITGGNKQERWAKTEQILASWQIGQFDRVILSLEGPSYGINQIRELIRQLALKPAASPYLVGIIPEAQLLTPQAQQALLKTLEEPTYHTRLILCAQNTLNLLPTILSRCLIINLRQISEYSSEEFRQCFKILEHLAKIPRGERLKISDEIAISKEKTLAWVELATATCRLAMLADYQLITTGYRLPASQACRMIRGLLSARDQLLINVNPKLVLDHLFLFFF